MINLTGLRLANPTILAAGILGSTGASLKRIAGLGAGAVVTKSIGPRPCTGYPNPTMVKIDGGFLNAMGLPNPSYQEFKGELASIKPALQSLGVPVIASIYGSTPEEFAEVASGLPADAFELNVSCPHAGGLTEIGTRTELVEEVCRAVKRKVEAPVWVKLTPNVTDIVEIGRSAERGGADAVVAINTLRGMAIDIESGFPILGNRFGGLSGPPIKPVAVKAVYDLYSALEIPVIGVGGISNWKDAIEFIMAGASAVEIGSAVYHSLQVFREIAEGVRKYLETRNLTLEDIRGIAHRR